MRRPFHSASTAPWLNIRSICLHTCNGYSPGSSVGLTNNVFYRVPFAINSNANITSINNLFYGTTNVSATNTTVSMLHYGGTSVNVHENDVYDGVAAALDGTYGYNADLHGASNTNNSTNSNDLWTNVTWVPGTYGDYYQPGTSPLLNNGSTNASNRVIGVAS
jgi:hypothetical protein